MRLILTEKFITMTLTGRPFEPEACGERISKNLKHKIRQLFTKNEVFNIKSTITSFDYNYSILR